MCVCARVRVCARVHAHRAAEDSQQSLAEPRKKEAVQGLWLGLWDPPARDFLFLSEQV